VAVNPDTGAPTRSQQARRSNDELARSAACLHFVSQVPFLCECSNPDCRELVLLALDEYEQARSQPIIASKHER
jgi:hypothetical protein